MKHRKMVVRNLSIHYCCEGMRDNFGRCRLLDVDPVQGVVFTESRLDGIKISFCPFCGADIVVEIDRYWKQEQTWV